MLANKLQVASANGIAIDDTYRQAVELLDQQIWCWGRDIEASEGNVLLKLGCKRIPAPDLGRHTKCLYVAQQSATRCVVLRGFGAFLSEKGAGTIFVRRYSFLPRFWASWDLTGLVEGSYAQITPWSIAEVPDRIIPSSDDVQQCRRLLLHLLDWIRSYEVRVAEHFAGISYRARSLDGWDNGKHRVIPAEQMASAWRELSFRVAANFECFRESDSEFDLMPLALRSEGKSTDLLGVDF